MNEIILTAGISSVIAGVVSAFFSSQLTIAGLRVHIEYLKDTAARHDKAITRAHGRIDRLAGVHGDSDE